MRPTVQSKAICMGSPLLISHEHSPNNTSSVPAQDHLTSTAGQHIDGAAEAASIDYHVELTQAPEEKEACRGVGRNVDVKR